MAAALLMSACPRGPDASRPDETLEIAVRQPTSIDPPFIRDNAGLLIARQVFEPLARAHPVTLEPAPLGASWEMHDGGARWIFRIHPRARFQNGASVNARDAVFALNRLAQKGTGSDLAFLMREIVGFEDVHGLGTQTDMPGLTVVDDRTFEVRLNAPWTAFPYVLTHPATAPVPREAVAADPAGFRQRPVGSGRYRLASALVAGSDITLASFARHRAGPPRVSRIVFRVYQQTLAAWQDMRAGRLDMTEIPPSEIVSAKAAFGAEGFRGVAGMLYLGFNMRSPKLQDVRFRKAVSLALDRASITRNAFGGTLSDHSGLIPAGVPGAGTSPCGTACNFDREASKKLVAEVFSGSIPEVAFDFPAGPSDEAFAAAVREQLSSVGVKVTLRPHETAEFVDLVEQGQHEIFRLGWVADYPSADWFLTPLFATAAADNDTGYSVAEVDDLLKRERASPTRGERLELFAAAETRILSDLPVVPIGQFQSHFAIGPRVRGIRLDVMGLFDVAEASFDEP